MSSYLSICTILCIQHHLINMEIPCVFLSLHICKVPVFPANIIAHYATTVDVSIFYVNEVPLYIQWNLSVKDTLGP